MPMTSRNWTIIICLAVTAICLSCCALNYAIDPFNVYGKTHLYSSIIKDHRITNASRIKHSDYQTAIIGTSHLGQLPIKPVIEQLAFHQPIKLVTPGAGLIQTHTVLKSVLEQGHRSLTFQIQLLGV